jgi:endonuclease/exonuclease/phosphatase (EEP) superfamily protein YafD
VRAIDADIPTGNGVDVRVVVNYWAHLAPYNWLTHRQHAQAFGGHLAAGEAGPTIIGGDFNEFKGMAAIRRLGGTYHRATGTFWQPTWRWHGKRHLLVRANYDNVLWSRGGVLELQQFEVLPLAPSDHAPLVARFNIN